MRIVHLLNDIDHPGNGIINITIDLACAQAALGHEVTVVSGGGHYEPLLRDSGVSHVPFPRPRRVQAVRARTRLGALIQSLAPDVVHAHNVTGVLLARAAGSGRRWRLVGTVHRDFRVAAAMAVADTVIVLNEQAVRRFRNLGMPPDRVRLVRNGALRGVRAATRPPTPLPELRRPALVTVAGLYVHKGLHDLVDAFAEVRREVPEATLYVVGEGPEEAALRRHVTAAGLSDAVELVGLQSPAQPWMAAADVFVLASHKDASPLVIAEAREAGVPVVATAVGGTPAMLDDGAAGILVPPRDPQALARAVLSLLTDPEAAQAWRSRGRTGVEQLSVQRMAQDVLSVYEAAGVTRGAARGRA